MAYGPFIYTDPQSGNRSLVTGFSPGSPAPLSPATLKGDPGNPVYARVSVSAEHFPIPPAATLNVSNAVGGGSVGANGKVFLGVDDQGALGPVSGDFVVQGDRYPATVCNTWLPSVFNAFQEDLPECSGYFGFTNNIQASDAWIVGQLTQCVPATLVDAVPFSTDSAVASIVGGSIVANDCAVVDLERHPQLGPLTDAGPTSTSLAVAVTAMDSARVRLANGTISGTTEAAVWTAPDPLFCAGVHQDDYHGYYSAPTRFCLDGGGDPIVFLENMNIVDNGCIGLLSQQGNIFADNTTIANNYIGVSQAYVYYGAGSQGQGSLPSEGSGLTDLAHLPDGGAASGNQVYCNTAQHASASCPNSAWHQPGIDVWNQTPQLLPADGVAWSQSPPIDWVCDANVDPSSCKSGSGPYSTGSLARVQSPDAFGAPSGPISAGGALIAANANCQ